jgi:sulfonate transport system ATP-binding protein
MAGVIIKGLRKAFDGVDVFSGVGLELTEGKITAILGPSGRGKTTLLRIICGLDKQTDGQVQMPEGATCSVAFQEPRLIPWLTIGENMSYCIGDAGMAKAISWLAELGLGDFADRFPCSMSGGERQRANLARALAAESSLLLLDEPFNSIGLGMKAELLPRLRAKFANEGRTVAMVTHSPVDVALMADRFYLMDGDGMGAQGPFGLNIEGVKRDLADEAMGREVHRLMLLMASLGTGVQKADGR